MKPAEVENFEMDPTGRVRANTYPPSSNSTRDSIPKSKTIDDYIKKDISKDTSLDLVQEVLMLLNITKLFTALSRKLVKQSNASGPSEVPVVRPARPFSDPALKSREFILRSPLGNCNKCGKTRPFQVECENCGIQQLFYCTKDLCWIDKIRRLKDTFVEKYPKTESEPWTVCIFCRTSIVEGKEMDIHQVPRYRVTRGPNKIPIFKLIQEKARTAQSGKFYHFCDLEDSCIGEDYRFTKLVPSDCPTCMRSRRVNYLCIVCNCLYTCQQIRPDYMVYSDYECPLHYYEKKYGKDGLGAAADTDLSRSVENIQLGDSPEKNTEEPAKMDDNE